MLSFDSPMREHTVLCTIRSMAQTLCYDLARAEKAKDGKKAYSNHTVALAFDDEPQCSFTDEFLQAMEQQLRLEWID